jgi:probable O-glycosylation ligase (exosortase A-associated)
MRDLVLIIFVVVCGLLALKRPVIGILTFVFLGFLNPQSMTWGLGRRLPFSQFVAISTIVGYFFSSEPKRLPRQRETFLLIALWAVFTVSTFLAFHPDKAFERLIFISKILLMVLFSTLIINDETKLRWFLRVIALSLGFYALKGGFFAFVTGGKYLVLGPEESFLEANNAIGLALGMNLPLLAYLIKTESNRWLRRVMIAMFIFTYPAIICTFSRGAWVGLGIATVLIIWKSRYRFVIVPALGVIGIVTLSYFPQVFPERVVDRYSDLVNYAEEASVQSRLANWECCRRIGMVNPIAGAGFDFYSVEIYEKYFPEFLERYPNKIWSCHGVWHTIFAEHGFPGIFVFVGLVISSLMSLRKIQSQGLANPPLSHYAEMLTAALITFGVVGTFYDAAYFDMFYYLVAAIIIIKEIILHKIIEAKTMV